METVLRVAVVYVIIMAGLRVLGKREFSQLSTGELVALLLIPELVAQSLIREDFSLTNAIIALITLFLLVFLNSVLQFYSKKFSRLVSSSPTILVARGELQEKAMSQERVSAEEIFGEMHKSGIERLEQVKWAILECDGHISIVPERPPAVVENRSDEVEIL